MLTNVHVGVLEGRARGRGEVAVAGADADDDVGLGREAVGGEGAGRADPAEVLRVVPGEGSAAGLRRADRDAGGLGEGAQLLLGVRSRARRRRRR